MATMMSGIGFPELMAAIGSQSTVPEQLPEKYQEVKQYIADTSWSRK